MAINWWLVLRATGHMIKDLWGHPIRNSIQQPLSKVGHIMDSRITNICVAVGSHRHLWDEWLYCKTHTHSQLMLISCLSVICWQLSPLKILHSTFCTVHSFTHSVFETLSLTNTMHRLLINEKIQGYEKQKQTKHLKGLDEQIISEQITSRCDPLPK